MAQMTWRCRNCGSASLCGSGECGRCGAERVRPAHGGLALVLSYGRSEDDEPGPMTEEEDREFMEAYGPREPAGPGRAKRFLMWAAGALLSVLAGIGLLIGTILGVTFLVGAMIKVRKMLR